MNEESPSRLPRKFWFLFSAQTLSQFGNMVQWIALPLWVAATTGSPIAAGFTFAVEVVPVVLLAPWTGYLADRLDRTKLIIACESLSALGTLLVLVGVQQRLLPLVFVALAVTKVFNAVSMPAGQAIIRSIVPRPLVRKAVSWYQVSTGGMATVGTALGVAIYGFFGLNAVLYINIASFLLGAALTIFVGSSKPADKIEKGVAAATRVAVKSLLARKRLTGVALAEVFYFFSFSGTMTIAVLISERELGASFSGLYPSGVGLGFLLISLLVVRRFGDRPRMLVLIGLGICAPLGFALWLAVGLNPALSFALGFIAGAANVLVGGGASVTYQKDVEEAVAGRIFGLRRAVTNLARAASHLWLPWLATQLSLGMAAAVGGVAAFCLGALALRFTLERPTQEDIESAEATLSAAPSSSAGAVK